MNIRPALLLLAIPFLTGCPSDMGELEKKPEFASGEDFSREGAQEISLGAVIVDNVDTINGDTTDWKYITVPASGVVTMRITFDNPKAFGEMLVTDERGQVLSNFKDENRAVLDNITFKATTGRYFMRMRANDLDTDYSLIVNYSAL